MIAYIALGLGAAVAGVVGYAASRPDTFRYERSITINASPETIWAFVADFHNFEKWSPWQKLDPGMKQIHTGSASGVGAVYEWVGSSKVGQGRMEITAAEPGKAVIVDLHFLKPFEARNVTEWLIEPQGGGAKVRWVMHGPQTFVSKLMGVVMNMEKMLGENFDEGLGNLKRVMEG